MSLSINLLALAAIWLMIPLNSLVFIFSTLLVHLDSKNILYLYGVNNTKVSKIWQSCKITQKDNPKLEQRPLKDGRISLYLEYYLGRTETPVVDEDGNPVLYTSGAMAGKPKVKITHNRKKETLPYYLIASPKTPAER